MARKRPRSFCQKCRCQVTLKHAYTFKPNEVGAGWLCRCLGIVLEPIQKKKDKLTRNSLGNTRLQSSQLAEPLWTGPGLKSGITVRDLISINNNNKKRRRGMSRRTFSQNPRMRWKSHHHRNHHHQHKIILRRRRLSERVKYPDSFNINFGGLYRERPQLSF